MLSETKNFSNTFTTSNKSLLLKKDDSQAIFAASMTTLSSWFLTCLRTKLINYGTSGESNY